MQRKITLQPPFPGFDAEDKRGRFLKHQDDRSPEAAAKNELKHIRIYETKHGMSSEKFFAKYPDHRTNGVIKEYEWFDWKLCYSTFQNMLKRYNLTLEEIDD